ncbi:MAG: hypothetical protein ACI865_002794, partial [Flavobacteriaceae bacterium]
LQKITFVLDGYWVIWSCLIVIKKNKTSRKIKPNSQQGL